MGKRLRNPDEKMTSLNGEECHQVGQRGFEPPTPWSRTKCVSPCATARGNQLGVIYLLLSFHVKQEVRLTPHALNGTFLDSVRSAETRCEKEVNDVR